MGYDTYVSGRIEITPWITWPEVRRMVEKTTAAPRNHDWRQHEYVVRDEVWHVEASSVVDYAEGISLEYVVHELEPDVYTRSVTAIVPDTEEATRAYQDDVASALVEIARDFAATADGAWRTFTGYLECKGEERGDQWRAYIIDGKPVIVEAEIHWPDPYAQEQEAAQ